jgi:predicted PurR-regulated permease PerM
MQVLQKIKIKNISCSTSLAAGITLIVLITLVSLGMYVLIPFIIKEIKVVSSTDLSLYAKSLEIWLHQADLYLHDYGFLSNNEHVSDILSLQMKSSMSAINFSSVLGNIFSFAGALIILLFSVIFLKFFELKDKEIFFKMIRSAIPISFRDNYDRILAQTRMQVVRYFSGLLLDNIIVGVVVGLACYFANVPNALLIGLLIGVLNTIPYVGPFIALGLSLIFSITSLLPTYPTAHELSVLFWKITIIFAVVKALDTFLLTPVIFGKSMKVHPIEIFIVILLAGYVGGITGMIFAVPAYSMIRIIIQEFFGSYYSEQEKLEP